MGRSLICSRHEPIHWTRHRADSKYIAGDEPGQWFCNICHEPPAPLAPYLESFNPIVHMEYLETKAGSAVVYTQADRMAVTYDEALATIKRWRKEDDGWVKARIVTMARINGEWHASEMVDEPKVPNAVQALSRAALIEKVNALGKIERRGTTYVWRLSATGRAYAAHLRRALGNTDRLPGPKQPTTEVDPHDRP